MRLCHNDVLAFNILLYPDNSVRFIDYEYAMFNARGFDLGNHFNEWAGPDMQYSRYPPRHVQLKWIEAYLSAWYEREGPHDPEEVEHLWREANQWSLMSHFLWALWGLIQHKNSKIAYDYMGYSNHRLALYFHNRDR
jgi:ethanolamine kinase